MSVYRRGGIWWYRFKFNGSTIRESSKSQSKTVAREAEKACRHQLVEGYHGIRKRDLPLFKLVAERWLAVKNGLSRFSELHYKQYVNSLNEHLGQRLVCDINLDDIAALQDKRRTAGLSNRTINAEVAVLRQVLKHFRQWGPLAGDVKFFRENKDTERAISPDDERRLFDAVRQSRSPALLPRFVLALDSGIRANEMRHLRHRDLTLTWRDGAIEQGWLTVSHSKTEGGQGRTIPLTRRACAVLTLWLGRSPKAEPDSYLFARHRVGIGGDKRQPYLYDVDLTKPGSEWKNAWTAACDTAKVHYRWHDLRHSFVTRLAENPAVSEGTIMALAGHVSKAMLARYSHVRQAAKLSAIAALEPARNTEPSTPDFGTDGAQKWAQSDTDDGASSAPIPEKALN